MEQVGQEKPQERLVPEGLDSRLCLEPHVTIRDPHNQTVDDPSCQQRQVDFPWRHLDSAHPSETAKVVDEMHHLPPRDPNTLSVVRPLSVESFGEVVAKVGHNQQRIPQIMGQGVAERL